MCVVYLSLSVSPNMERSSCSFGVEVTLGARDAREDRVGVPGTVSAGRAELAEVREAV